MRKILERTTLIGVLVLMFAGLSVVKAQGFDITSPCITDGNLTEQGDRVCIPIYAKDLTNFEVVNFQIRFNQFLFKVDTVIIPVINPFRFNVGLVNFNTPGEVNVLGFPPSPASASPTDTLLMICGTLTGAVGKTLAFSLDKKQSDFLRNGISIDNNLVNFTLCPITISPRNNAVTLLSGMCGTSGSGVSDGSISIGAIGGMGPYTLTLRNSVTNNLVYSGNFSGKDTLFTNLPSGQYGAIVSDANNSNSTPININITSGDKFQVSKEFSFILRAPSCAPDNINYGNATNGSIRLTAIEPLLNYDFLWDGSFAESGNKSFYSELQKGTYRLRVTNAQGCEADSTFTLDVPDFKATLELISPLPCALQNLNVFAQYRITPVGGVAPYRYQINTETSGAARSLVPIIQVPFGSRRINVYDKNNCQIDFSLFDGVNSTVPFDSVSLNINEINFNCFDTKDSTLIISSTSKSPANQYRIFGITEESISKDSSINYFPSFAYNFKEGIYKVKAGYPIGPNRTICDTTYTITVTKPTKPNYSFAVVQPSCGAKGSVVANATGGTAPFTYKWTANNVPISTTNNSLTNLDTAATYTLRIADATVANCPNVIKDTTFVIKQSESIKIDSVPILQTLQCTRPAIMEAYTAEPGTIRYTWSNGATTKSISTALAGKYYVTITSSTGCTAVDSVTIVVPKTIELSPITRVNPTCWNTPNGQLRFGGARINNVPVNPATLVISWYRDNQQNPVGTDQVASSLTGGTYRLRVTDSDGCTAEIRDTLTTPDTINISLVPNSIKGPACSGRLTGVAQVLATSKATGTITYQWSSNRSTSFIDSTLSEGSNWVIARLNGCISDTLPILIPNAVTPTITSTLTPASCRGVNNGSITLNIDGKVGDTYQIRWLNIPAGAKADSIKLDSITTGSYMYAIAVNNDINCAFTNTINFDTTRLFKIGVDSINSSLSSCSSQSAAKLALKLVNGIGPITYRLNGNPIVGNVATGLTTGMYEIIGQSTIGCRDTIRDFSLSFNAPVRGVLAQIDSIKCTGAATCIKVENASGGSGRGYQFAVNLGNNKPLTECFNANAGRYNIRVFDSEGCSYDTTIVIGEPKRFTIDLGEDITYQLGEDLPNITATATSSGDRIVGVAWADPSLIQCQDPTCAAIQLAQNGTFILSAQAQNERGCLATGSVNISLLQKENIYFPNVFANNALDGDNLSWKIKFDPNRGVERINRVAILDRWGNVLYQESNITNDVNYLGWDGRVNVSNANTGDAYVNDGVYVYTAEVQFKQVGTEPAKVKIYSGTLTFLNTRNR